MKLLLVVATSTLLLTSCSSNPDSFDVAEKHFHISELDAAKENYLKVDKTSENFKEAQRKIKTIDSLNAIYYAEKKISDSIYKVEREKKNLTELLELLDLEIMSVDHFNVQKNILDVNDVKSKLSVFKDWKNVIERARKYENEDVLKKANKLEDKVKKFSSGAFPKLRKSYADLAKSLLWEEDIVVNLKGSRNTTIEFVGGFFASNKNIKDFQSNMSSLLRELRFKRVNYKFTKYDDEYTYYDITSLKDDEI